MSKSETLTTIIGIIVGGLLLFGLGSCGYDLVIDNRERKQDKIEQCIDKGYGGMVELSDGRSFVCTGGAVDGGSTD